jgi:hypothetical protein
MSKTVFCIKSIIYLGSISFIVITKAIFVISLGTGSKSTSLTIISYSLPLGSLGASKTRDTKKVQLDTSFFEMFKLYGVKGFMDSTGTNTDIMSSRVFLSLRYSAMKPFAVSIP